MEDSQWTMTADDVTTCRIEHQIPRFGSVAFTHQAGRNLRFELYSAQQFGKGIDVKLRSETNTWNPGVRRTTSARFETTGGKGLLRIPAKVAEQIYHDLKAGYRPGFKFAGDYPLIASVSNVRFGEVEAKFAQCVERLYERNFDDVRVSSIHFEPDNEFASIREEELAFVKMLDYLQVDNAISEIVVSGHADHTGTVCYNDGLSERRAWYVYDLLIALGIDSQLLRVDYFGEHNPLRKGNKKNSLAANRRVTVELRR